MSPPLTTGPEVAVDLAALTANYRALAALQPGTTPAATVKCDGYGLGAGPAARALAREAGCATFFVAWAAEGAALRAALGALAPDARIYVLHGPQEHDLKRFLDFDLSPVLNTIRQVALWTAEGRGAPAALHLDVGMNRLGLPAADDPDPAALDAAHQAACAGGLRVDLVMGHLSCAADPAHPANRRERDRFLEAAARFPDAARSLSASAGAMLGPDYGFELSRLGIGLYGGGPQDAVDPRLAPVATLTAPVLQVRDVAAGAAVGYGGTFHVKRRRGGGAAGARIATLGLGYGDGFPRAGSGRAAAFVGGAPCPFAGRISMDLITVDVSDAPAAVAEGDRAELFGPRLSLDAQAAACGTLAYELLTGLGPRVARRYLWAGAPADAGLTGDAAR